MSAFILRASADPIPARTARVDVETSKTNRQAGRAAKVARNPATTPTPPSRG
ncbi:hypothetical protein ACFQZ4_35810 [Catellatospora coxensis]